ncbi:MAG: TerB family tellurite resistance protein [Candidatus Synoicihabitans palmerolidicus]|nr:TerB family tellurite resistance protein [Candidatus Synoicihabitans palmerolidicus]
MVRKTRNYNYKSARPVQPTGSTSLFKLFKSKDASIADGLAQPQREAIVDLLHYCLYADGHIAVAEGKVIDSFVTTLNGDPNTGFSNYEAKSISNARFAREDDEFRGEFLESIRLRINSESVRKTALGVVRELMASDGVKTDAEEAILATVRKLFV